MVAACEAFDWLMPVQFFCFWGCMHMDHWQIIIQVYRCLGR